MLLDDESIFYVRESDSIFFITIAADPSILMISPGENAALQIFPDFSIFKTDFFASVSEHLAISKHYKIY